MSRHPNPLVLAICAAVLLLVTWPAFAGQTAAQSLPKPNGSATAYPINPETAPRPNLRALEISDAMRIDGRLDEPAWLRADSATDFITGLPRDGYPASERTVARVLFDGVTLYVGACLHDREPQRLYSPGLEQDFDTHDADLFGVVFDAFLDRQNSITFD